MLLLLFRALSKLPLPVLHATGALLGRAAYALSPGYRRRLNENIARAGHASHRAAAIREAGKSVMELPFLWCAPPEQVLAKVTMENWEVARASIDSGRGALFLTPHLGCFEIIPQAVSTYVPVIVMYRPPRKKALRPLVEQARARARLALAPASMSGVRMLLRSLRAGGPVGLLPDQVPQQGEGVWAPFFGKDAYTMTLPGRLQQMTGCDVIITWAERLPHGRGYLVRFFRHEGPFGATPAEQAATINAAMEGLIAQCPAQYFWSYNRYKSPAGASVPGSDGDDKAPPGDAA
ncbi:lysophospholipid acyltransferase family protein [Lacisediminimonas sp.]|uniref:lysophospholipid acyltransferase family protein n=1 Tax=Lacisediminimonas sp. TaxID=3060582 RepID=UPI002718B8D0|nr:lysophospholipid acyltransferase family protein [Lacisediminimonas sp.]MDO8299012.1 lysophospholipid acyltransferase family protein [Lacisediminimonas sp.]